MNEAINIVENVRICLFVFCLFYFWKRKKKGCINRRMKITDELSEATGIYQKCLSSIHTELMANDGKILSLIKVLHQ